MEKLAEVSDQEIHIDFTLGAKCRSNVTLKSLSPKSHIAFKIQTSSPHKFLVNPPSGLIPPLSSTVFQITLKAQNQIPATFPRSPSDRFMIRTAVAPHRGFDSSSGPELINSWFNSLSSNVATCDIKLKVVFVGLFLLRQAVGAGYCEAVRSIIKRQKGLIPDLSSQDSASLYRAAIRLDNSKAPAASSRSEEMVDLLLEAGLKVESEPDIDDDVIWVTKTKGWTELHMAALFGRVEVVEKILSLKVVFLDERDKEGRTPLHLAANRGYVRCAQLLMSAGAEVDARSEDGRTPLFRAAANSDREMVEALIEMGANPTIIEREPGCRSAIDVAKYKGQHEIVKILEQGETVLHAARRGELQNLKSLLSKGATMNFSDQYGLTALHLAAIKGNKDVALILIDFGADLECQDVEGNTPLNLAVKSGSIETVKLLIDRGANVNAKSKKGVSPLFVSCLIRHEGISKLLVENGALCEFNSPRSFL